MIKVSGEMTLKCRYYEVELPITEEKFYSMSVENQMDLIASYGDVHNIIENGEWDSWGFSVDELEEVENDK